MKKSIFIFLLVSGFYLFLQVESFYLFVNLRLPRYLLATLAGAVLSTCGNTYQMMLENPLAEPYVLGISSGAALGSTIALFLGQIILMPVFGFLGSLFTMMLIFKLVGADFSKTKLILTGVVINYFIFALLYIAILLFSYDSFGGFSILLGNLDYIFTKSEFNYFIAIFFLCLLLLGYLIYHSNKIYALSFGRQISTSLGVDVVKTRKRLFIVTSILVGITTSYVGIIGFVGLIVPFGLRLIFGISSRKLPILNIFYGAVFVMLADTLAVRVSPINLPIGAITALIGSPVFVWLVVRKQVV